MCYEWMLWIEYKKNCHRLRWKHGHIRLICYPNVWTVTGLKERKRLNTLWRKVTTILTIQICFVFLLVHFIHSIFLYFLCSIFLQIHIFHNVKVNNTEHQETYPHFDCDMFWLHVTYQFRVHLSIAIKKLKKYLFEFYEYIKTYL